MQTQTLTTCGAAHVRTTFSYQGSVQRGITLSFKHGDFSISAGIIQKILIHFRGQQVRGGFSMTKPSPGGVGEYLAGQGNSLTPRHASFLCAILQHERFAVCHLHGNAVMVTFNDAPSAL